MADPITAIADYLKVKRSPAKGIEQVRIILSPAFIGGIAKEFPKAQVVFDRYHVKALLDPPNGGDDLRKQEVKKHHMLKGQKYLFLRGEQDLKAYQVHLRNLGPETLPTLGEAYRPNTISQYRSTRSTCSPRGRDDDAFSALLLR